MDYDTINLLGLQPNDIQDINIVKSNDVILINVTLTRRIKPCPRCGSLSSNIKDYKIKKSLILFSTLIKLLSIIDVDVLFVRIVMRLLWKIIL